MKQNSSLQKTILLFCSLIFVAPALLAQQMSYVTPQRIAVAGGSITEIIYRFGEQERIIGVDSTSTYPPHVQDEKILLGYVRNISVEGTLSLKPDLLIGEPDTGPSKNLDQLKQTNLRIEILSDDTSIAGIQQKITRVAQLLDVPEKGKVLLNEIQADIDALAFAKQQLTKKPKVLFLLSLSGGVPNAAGHTTSADSVISLAGGQNALASKQGWNKLSPESALALNPDAIIIMNRKDKEGLLEQAKQMPHFRHSNAVKNNAVYAIDGSYLLGFGPRTVQAINELGTMIHTNFRLPKDYVFRYPNESKTVISPH